MTHQTKTEEWEKEFDLVWELCSVGTLSDEDKRESVKDYISRLLKDKDILLQTAREEEHKAMKKDFDLLVPVQGNENHNKALLRLLNRNLSILTKEE